MTLDQELAQYNGQSLLVPGDTEADRGQCVQWVDYVLHDVYGLPYHYGNAIDWWNNPGELLNHFDKVTDGSIKKGDFVIFNSQVGSVYGHIDVAMSDGSTGNFTGADSNWGGNKTVHIVQHSNPGYVLGSLRLKGGEMSATSLNDVRMVNAFICGNNGLGGKPNALAGDLDSQLQGWVGKDVQVMLESFYNSDEAKNYRQSVLPGVYAAAQNPPGVKPYSGPQLYTKA